MIGFIQPGNCILHEHFVRCCSTRVNVTHVPESGSRCNELFRSTVEAVYVSSLFFFFINFPHHTKYHALHEREMPVGLAYCSESIFKFSFFFFFFFVRTDALMLSHEQTFAHDCVRYNIYIRLVHAKAYVFSRPILVHHIR